MLKYSNTMTKKRHHISNNTENISDVVFKWIYSISVQHRVNTNMAWSIDEIREEEEGEP